MNVSRRAFDSTMFATVGPVHSQANPAHVAVAMLPFDGSFGLFMCHELHKCARLFRKHLDEADLAKVVKHIAEITIGNLGCIHSTHPHGCDRVVGRLADARAIRHFREHFVRHRVIHAVESVAHVLLRQRIVSLRRGHLVAVRAAGPAVALPFHIEGADMRQVALVVRLLARHAHERCMCRSRGSTRVVVRVSERIAVLGQRSLLAEEVRLVGSTLRHGHSQLLLLREKLVPHLHGEPVGEVQDADLAHVLGLGASLAQLRLFVAGNASRAPAEHGERALADLASLPELLPLHAHVRVVAEARFAHDGETAVFPRGLRGVSTNAHHTTLCRHD